MQREIPPEVRAYMSELGKTKSEAKTRAIKENLAKGALARRKDALSLPCTCGGCPDNPKTTCSRGRLLRQRQKSAEASKRATEEA